MRLAFGTARIHRSGSAEIAERILASAYEAGFRQFDTAPIYGFGAAERLLRDVARQPDVRIATKVGLYPPGGAEQSRFQMLARKVGGKLLPGLSRMVASGSVATARQSLDGSLRRLGRDRVELLLIHEPQIDLLATDEWLRFFETERQRVAAFGLAGDPDLLLPFVRSNNPLAATLQTRDAHCEADSLRALGRVPDLLYGFSAAPATRSALVDAARARAPDATIIVSSRDPRSLREQLQVA